MFVGPNYIEIEKKVESAYSDQFLKKVYKSLNITDEDKQTKFRNCIFYASISYLNALDMNSKRITPREQDKILDEYADSLIQVKEKYKNVQKYGTTSSKLHKALEKLVRETNDPGMKEMFHPYIDKNQGSIAIDLFDRFISILAQGSQEAKNQNVGKDKANIKSGYLAWWVALIRVEWKSFTNTDFILGKYYKENKAQGGYYSACPEILHALISPINPKITKKNIETAMRKVIKTDINQNVANFFL